MKMTIKIFLALAFGFWNLLYVFLDFRNGEIDGWTVLNFLLGALLIGVAVVASLEMIRIVRK